MNRYEELSALVAVVEQGSFSAAAEYLDTAKSAVSRRIADLESRLGARLLNRTTRRIHLTDAGSALYERAISILADWQEAEHMVSADHAQLSGRLKVSTPLTFGLRYLGPVVAEFATAHPEVQLDIDLSDREVDLIAEGFDIAIRIGKLADSSLVAKRLTDIHLVCVASPGYLQTHGRPQTPEQLKHHQSLRYSLNKHTTWQFHDPQGRLSQGKPRTALTANNGDHINELCQAGLGIARLPMFIAHQGIRSGKLEIILADYKQSTLGLFMVFPPGRQLSRRVREFADHMARQFQDSPPWGDCPLD